MKFHVADTLTGTLVGRLEPSTWEVTDPVTGSAEGSLQIPVGNDAERLRELLQERRRQIAIEDPSGTFLTGGPITAPPAGKDGVLTVAFADWRTWWYRALLWPNTDGTRRDHFAVAVEQMTILTDIAAIGLSHPAAPNMVVDTPVASGITRTRTFRMLTSLGAGVFDDLARTERGPDWWTYITRDATVLTPHLTFAYPYRAPRTSPIVVRHQVGRNGNGRDLAWPSGQDRPNVIYGIGSGAPPDQGWSVAEAGEVTAGTELVWPEVWNLPSETKTRAQAFEHTYARLEAITRTAGTITVTVPADEPPVAEYGPGDLARLIADDGWRTLDLPSTRILSRKIRGTGEEATEVELTLDLGFNPADPDAVPGEAVT